MCGRSAGVRGSCGGLGVGFLRFWFRPVGWWLSWCLCCGLVWCLVRPCLLLALLGHARVAAFWGQGRSCLFLLRVRICMLIVPDE